MELRILHTNDVHSRFENFAKVVSAIKQLKDKDTILLDAGDFNDFSRLELQGTGGMAGVELLSAAGYDAIAVGNNETFQGMDTLQKMAVSSSVPFLACNLYKNDSSSFEGIKKSIIVEKGGLRILIIGACPRLPESFDLYNMKTIDETAVIRQEMERYAGEIDICILLSHLGLREDVELAKRIDGIDIIIGGHSHVLMDKPELVGKTIIHQSGSFGENLGVLEIEYDKRVVSCRGVNFNVLSLPPDGEIIECISKNRERAIDVLGVPLYNIDYSLWHDVMEENPITNLLADALRDVFKCDMGLINSGILNGGIMKGPVSRKKLLEICPSPLNPAYMEIQGKNIMSALKKSMYADYCSRSGRGPGFRGRFLGKLHMSGAVVEHDGRNIMRVLINGVELQNEKWYSVATSDYLQGGIGYEELGDNRNERYDAEYIRDTLKHYLCREDFIESSFVNRWINIKSVIPILLK